MRKLSLNQQSLRLTAVVALLITMALPAAAQQKEILIRNATVLTVTNGVIENGSVLIRGTRIAAVGPADSVRASANAEVIDATGRYVFPGIIDAHSHAGVVGSVNEGSLPNTGMVRIHDVLMNEDITSYRQLAGGTTAANILHGSANAIGGQNAVVKWKWGKPISEWPIPTAPAGIKFALGENPKSSNWNVPSGQTRPYPNTRMGVEEVIRDAFVSAKAYMASWDEYEADRRRRLDPIPPKKDILMETMAGILRGEIDVHSHCYRSDEIVMLIRVAEEMGFKVKTFQHVLEGYKVAPEIAAHGAGGSTFIDWWGFKMEAYDATPYNVALMYRDGVLTAVNSDSDELGRRLNQDAAKAMKYGGLTADEAMRLCTINPARQLGIEDRVGSIEVGKDADLVIWTAHPLSTYARVETTLIEGEIYFDRQRDLAMRESLKQEKQRLLDMEKAAADLEKKTKKTKKKEVTR
ncbi:MAG TPA: amidohydrolase family protein [Thermoanaerobaculia bacterium]|nr:amidohydrolase family protein [Thermoanaerobaculia bacterium]